MLLLQFGWTPLHDACWKGQVEEVQLLINNHADISATTNVSNFVVGYITVGV